MSDVEKKLLDEILLLMKKYPDFDAPFFRTDGDLVIPLNKMTQVRNEKTKLGFRINFGFWQ